MTSANMPNYPKQTILPWSKLPVTVRPLEVGDAQKLLEFFNRIPEEDRFFLRDDVTSPEVINQWVRHMDFNRVLPLLAVVEDEIAADATIHWNRAKARRHKAEIRIVVDPKFRNQGLGTHMARHVIDAAFCAGLTSLEFHLIEGKEAEAIRMAERLGFEQVASIPNFARDMEGAEHAMVVMELSLRNWMQWWSF